MNVYEMAECQSAAHDRGAIAMLGYPMLRQIASQFGLRKKVQPGGHMMPDAKPAPIPQDTERFKLLFTNSRLKLADGFSAPLDFKPTRTLIRERLAALKQQPCR